MNNIENEKLSALTNLMELLLTHTQASTDYERFTHNYGLYEAFHIDIQLHPREIHVLKAVYDNEGISSNELTRIFRRTKGAISQIIKVLEKNQLIIKKSNPDNYKIINLYTTEIGRVACVNHDSTEAELYRALLSNLPDYTVEEFQRFAEMLSTATKHVISWTEAEIEKKH